MMTLNKPMHVGDFLYKAYMVPLNINGTDLAERLQVSSSSVNRLVNGKADLSYDMALRLSRVLGRTPEGWMNIQTNFGLYRAKSKQ